MVSDVLERCNDVKKRGTRSVWAVAKYGGSTKDWCKNKQNKHAVSCPPKSYDFGLYVEDTDLIRVTAGARWEPPHFRYTSTTSLSAFSTHKYTAASGAF